jgi:serine/threonine-protein kinase HipA
MSLKISYNNLSVGKLVKYKNQYHFKYDDSFLNTGFDLAPIQMPLAKSSDRIYSFPHLNPNTFHGLPGLLSDSLPDHFGHTILNTWLNNNGKDINQLDAIEKLCYIGKRAVGALEFTPEDHVLLESDDKRIHLNKLSEISQQISSQKNQREIKTTDALIQMADIGTTVGGARAKAAVSINNTTGQIRLNHSKEDKDFYSYIIKFDTVSEITNMSTEVCQIEYAYYKMVRKAGIDMMTSKLIEEYGRFHFATKRFDRTNAGKKLHTQSLCAIGHYDFRDFRQNSYENLFYVARALKTDYRDKEQFYRIMILNVLSRNQNDHSKNFGFLMKEDGKWKASPAFDINFSYDPSDPFKSDHKMSINGKFNDFNRTDIIELGRKNSINKPEKIFEEVKEAVSLFHQIARNIGVSRKMRGYIYGTFRMDL